MGQLDDKVAIVTGASSGIGEATARALAAEGVAVTLAARRKERLEALKEEIEKDGGRALVVETDVTSRADVRRLADETKAAFGRIDILVNNAGLMPLSYVKNLHVDEWERMVDVNVKGVLFCTAAALPAMLEGGGGHVVNVSSVAGRRAFVGGAVYCATKFAVRAFSDGLRLELAPEHHIRVTTIEPGAVATELTETITDEELMEATKGRFESMQILDAEDIARSVLHAVTAPPPRQHQRGARDADGAAGLRAGGSVGSVGRSFFRMGRKGRVGGMGRGWR